MILNSEACFKGILDYIQKEENECVPDMEGIHLESSYFRSRWDELKEIALTPVELEKAEFSLPEIGKLTAKLRRADVSSRRQVRDVLTPQLPSLDFSF